MGSRLKKPFRSWRADDYMKKNKISIVMVGVIIFALFFVRIGHTDSSDRWILYGTSAMGDSYYDKYSITEVSPQIIQVWNKDKYSKIGKDEIIQGRKNYNLSIEGYDRLDYVTDIIELDCVNRTIKDIMFVEYNNEDKVLYEYDFPNPKITHILPGTTTETLLKTVCR
jgi:hypothetical protein